MTEAPDEPHSSETAYNGTALRHAPAIIHAHKSKGAKWGRSGHWIINPSFGMSVEYIRADIAAAQVDALTKERDEALASIRKVQNAAKTIASAHGSELEHLRQNATYDYRLRAEHESLQERDAQMTEALLTAEGECAALRALLREAGEALRPFAQEERSPLYTDASAELISVTSGDLRRARAVLAKMDALG